MKILLSFSFLIYFFNSIILAYNGNSSVIYQTAFCKLENLIKAGNQQSFEKAIFIIESAYNQDSLSYEKFKSQLNFHTHRIQLLAQANLDRIKNSKNANIHGIQTESLQEQQINNYKVLLNWAIFTYMTDTTWWKEGETYLPQFPMVYNYDDPFGHEDWKNTMVSSLLDPTNLKGNCFSLASLFYIFSKRLQSEAYLTTAPQHVFIQHKGFDGDYYNVELATQSFPGAGSIKAYTNTSHSAVANGIAMRRLNEKQAISLCLVYLAKGYERKNENADDNFILQCADLALQYDSLCLSAMLLKKQALEKIVEVEGCLNENKQLFHKATTDDLPYTNPFQSFGNNEMYYSLSHPKNRIANDKTLFALAVDPLAFQQPSWSPYKAFYDNPVTWVDPDGRTEWRNSSGSLVYDDGNDNKISYRLNEGYDKSLDYSNVTHGGLDLNSNEYQNLLQFSSHSIMGNALIDYFNSIPAEDRYPGYGANNTCTGLALRRSKSAFESQYNKELEVFLREKGLSYEIFRDIFYTEKSDNNNDGRPDVLNADPRYVGKGSAGAIAYAGLGDIVESNNIWSGELRPGDVVQVWDKKADYRSIQQTGRMGTKSSYGHSFIFLGYKYDDNGTIVGMNIWDQGTAISSGRDSNGGADPTDWDLMFGGKWKE